MPLARFALYESGVEIYVAPPRTTPTRVAGDASSTSPVSRCFVVAPCHFRRVRVPGRLPARRAPRRPRPPRSRGGLVIGPDGSYLGGPLYGEEGILYGLDPARLVEERQRFDPAGHYHRPDVLRLEVTPTGATSAPLIDPPTTSAGWSAAIGESGPWRRVTTHESGSPWGRCTSSGARRSSPSRSWSAISRRSWHVRAAHRRRRRASRVRPSARGDRGATGSGDDRSAPRSSSAGCSSSSATGASPGRSRPSRPESRCSSARSRSGSSCSIGSSSEDACRPPRMSASCSGFVGLGFLFDPFGEGSVDRLGALVIVLGALSWSGRLAVLAWRVPAAPTARLRRARLALRRRAAAPRLARDGALRDARLSQDALLALGYLIVARSFVGFDLRLAAAGRADLARRNVRVRQPDRRRVPRVGAPGRGGHRADGRGGSGDRPLGRPDRAGERLGGRA